MTRINLIPPQELWPSILRRKPMTNKEFDPDKIVDVTDE